jgi:hypothetical protein
MLKFQKPVEKPPEVLEISGGSFSSMFQYY